MMHGKAQQNAYTQSEKNAEKIRLQITTLLGEIRNTVKFDDVINDIENYIPTEEDLPAEFTSKTNLILTTITNVGMAASVLIIAVLGIKYMLGSIEEKAEYKKDMIPYLVGAFLLFGITTIVKILLQWGQTINNI